LSSKIRITDPQQQIAKAKRENNFIIFSKSFAFGSGLLLALNVICNAVPKNER